MLRRGRAPTDASVGSQRLEHAWESIYNDRRMRSRMGYLVLLESLVRGTAVLIATQAQTHLAVS